MQSRMNSEQLNAIKGRAEKAKKGQTPEWYVDDEYLDTVRDSWSGELITHSIPTKADAEFIAHAREDIPQLVAEVERLRRIISDIQLFSDIETAVSELAKEALGE